MKCYSAQGSTRLLVILFYSFVSYRSGTIYYCLFGFSIPATTETDRTETPAFSAFLSLFLVILFRPCQCIALSPGRVR